MEDCRSQTEKFSADAEVPPNNVTLTYDKEYEKLRALWDKAFNDPEEFSDYYFEEVCKKNKILSAYDKEHLVGMVHMNPYKVYYDGEIVDSYYIVGVAVEKHYRGQGIMKQMIERVSFDAKKEGVPFVFLMPKMEEYYISSGFKKVYNTRQLEYTVIDDEESEREISDYYASLMLYTEHLSEIGEDIFDKVSENINDKLKAKYCTFCLRDTDYLKTMVDEHRCQNGDVCVVTEHMMDEREDDEDINLIGMFSYDIYDDTMYVDRFEAFVDNTLALVVAVLKQTIEVSCSRCVITVAESDLEDFDLPLSEIEVDISDGKGIMVLPICDNGNRCMEKFNKGCFIDEIV